MKITRLATLAIAVLVLAGPAGAVNTTWQAVGGNYSGSWDDINHWASGLPVAGEISFVNFTSATPATITLATDTVALGHLYLQGGNNRDVEIDLAGKTLNTGSVRAPYSAYGGTIKATFSSSAAGGTVNASSYLYVGFAAATQFSTTYVTIADDVAASFPGISQIGTFGGTKGGDAFLNLEDTSSTTFSGPFLWVGRGTNANTSVSGTVTVSDTATLAVTNSAEFGNIGTNIETQGNLTIDGGSTSASIGGSVTWDEGTFNVILDHATNFNKVTVAGNLTIDDDGDDGDVILDVDLDGVTPAGGTIFDVMSYGVNRTGQFTLAAEDVGEWNVIYNDAEKLIQIEKVATVAIPEPATFALLLTGVVAVARRRRRA